MQLNTVNVITYREGTVLGVTSFKENAQGNKEAEKLFVNLIEENHGKQDEEVLTASLDNGYFEDDGWQVFLTHAYAS